MLLMSICAKIIVAVLFRFNILGANSFVRLNETPYQHEDPVVVTGRDHISQLHAKAGRHKNSGCTRCQPVYTPGPEPGHG